MKTVDNFSAENYSSNDLYIGVEIGGTKHQIALGNAAGELLSTLQGKVVLEEGAEGILNWMKANIPELLTRAAELGGKVAAIAIGFGGIIESSTGKVLTSVQVEGWKDFGLKEWFEAAFKLPAIVLNDTVAAGYGEYLIGSGAGTEQFFYTNIGSGIGGVFILGGQIYDGQGFGAAYFGHTYLPDWTSNKPGAAGKVEDLCSGWAIEARLRSAQYVPVDSLIMLYCDGVRESIKCVMLSDAAKAGDAFALAEIDRIADSYSIGLANIITLMSPECVSIGGGVSNMGDILLNPVRRYVEERVFIASKGRYRIVKCSFGDQAVLIGAVLYASKNKP